ncbi:MAG TPA: ABC transporter ATP-binding protein [Tepidisphaeraceae bacterium]|nr:ABC transporter ATP-binding protein [Tepidisphaeraceae bacterium]
MIQIQHLIKQFGRQRAVDDVTFTIEPGESVALWGSNGAGKSTILRCLLGLMRFKGQIEVFGNDVRRHGKRVRQMVGYVPQELGFYDDLRVLEAIRYFGTLKNVNTIDADSALDRVGLRGHERKCIRQLSGGMKQRLALAIALLGDPPVLVLDEVTASLDAVGRREFIHLLASLVADQSVQRRSILFASHRVEEIDALATRVLRLERGKVIVDQSALSFSTMIRAEESESIKSLLRLFIEPRADSSRAITLLQSSGFDARMNGRGVYVAVEHGQRGVPLRLLADAGMRIDDFEFVTHAEEDRK